MKTKWVKLQKQLNQVFICYRRESSNWVAGRIYDRLIQKFGKDAIFKDIDSIPLGSNFKQYIDTVVQQCQVLLAIIDEKWTGDENGSNHRRIDEPHDFVRLEIKSAFHYDVRIIPLFVNNTVISPASLPPSLKTLSELHGMRVNSDPYFHRDMDHLINHLEPILQFKKSDKRLLRLLLIFAIIFIGSLLLAVLIALITLPWK